MDVIRQEEPAVPRLVRVRYGRRGPARGQALILAVVALLVLCLGLIVLFNSGQAVTKKVELVNTADAAAYSAAVQQARAYNLIAYMNRASVANEVAVAQMVSWQSWMNFTLRGTDNFKDAVQTIAILFDISVVGAEVGAALQKVVKALKQVKSAVEKLRDGMKAAFSTATTLIGTLNAAYSKASYAIATVESQEALKIAPEVVKRNTDGKAKIAARGYIILEGQALLATKYAKRYVIPSNGHRNDGADRYADVVMEARDIFSRERSDELGPLYKRGGTDLVDYKYWVGVDTLNAKWECCWFIDIDVPLAWGGAAAVHGSPKSFSSVAKPGINNGKGWDSEYDNDHGHYERYAGGIDNGNAGKEAVKDPAIGGTDKAWIKSYAASPGLQDYNDIDPGKATVPYRNGKDKKQDVGPVFTVLVEQPINTVRTSSNVAGIGGPPDFEAPDKAVGNAMTALSSAQVYFSRPRELFPRETDSRRELGNLFSPYWQARLVDTPCSLRLVIGATYGSAVPTCAPGGH